MFYLIVALSILTSSVYAANTEGDGAPTYIPKNVLRTLPAGPQNGNISDSDTGYDTLSTQSHELSSQSSIAAQMGSQEILAQRQSFPSAPKTLFNQPEDTLLSQIRYVAAQGAFIFTSEECQSINAIHSLVAQKRKFVNQLRAYMLSHFSHTLSKNQIICCVNRLAQNIRDNQENYWEIKKEILSSLRSAGLSDDQVRTMDQAVMCPHEKTCRLSVQQCAETITVFGTGPGRSPMRRLSDRRKTASHEALRRVVSRLSDILDGTVA